MKIIVTHNSPDWDGITSIWLIKRFLAGWENTALRFVPAGERVANSKFKIPASQRGEQNSKLEEPIERIGDDEVIQVDTGLGPLDHHQTSDQNVCAASLTWDYVKQVQSSKFNPSASLRSSTPRSLRRSSRGLSPEGLEEARVQSSKTEKVKDQEEAIDRIVRIVVDIDHFKEVFWENPTADYHEFSLISLLDGLKLQKPDQDEYYVEFGLQCLDGVLHSFENRIWAEKEIRENGKEFETRFGKGIGFETINDTVVKLSQKMEYVMAVRKDPRKGYVRIKARPSKEGEKGIDLTLMYENLKKIDPDATWFLHASKKMLLNGTAKNPKMKPTKLTLSEIIKVLEKI
ncbi:MAG: hypothetical protein HYT83_03150 [Candidatus Levybacteria bacterium]|nr:hypothetical protein [Candidatus Levybacteria bacterium]